MNLYPISTAPIEKEILLYWEESKHFENGTMYLMEDSGIAYHVLFDGESMNCHPTHWAELPNFLFT